MSGPTLLDQAVSWSFILSGFAAFVGLAYGGLKVVRHWRGESLKKRVEDIYQQTQTNGGSSMRDDIKDIKSDVKSLSQTVNSLANSLSEHLGYHAGQERHIGWGD